LIYRCVVYVVCGGVVYVQRCVVQQDLTVYLYLVMDGDRVMYWSYLVHNQHCFAGWPGVTMITAAPRSEVDAVTLSMHTGTSTAQVSFEQSVFYSGRSHEVRCATTATSANQVSVLQTHAPVAVLLQDLSHFVRLSSQCTELDLPHLLTVSAGVGCSAVTRVVAADLLAESTPVTRVL